jgi:hypothetical protein
MEKHLHEQKRQREKDKKIYKVINTKRQRERGMIQNNSVSIEVLCYLKRCARLYTS